MLVAFRRIPIRYLEPTATCTMRSHSKLRTLNKHTKELQSSCIPGTHPHITPLLHKVSGAHEEQQHKPHNTFHDPLRQREHSSASAPPIVKNSFIPCMTRPVISSVYSPLVGLLPPPVPRGPVTSLHPLQTRNSTPSAASIYYKLIPTDAMEQFLLYSPSQQQILLKFHSGF